MEKIINMDTILTVTEGFDHSYRVHKRVPRNGAENYGSIVKCAFSKEYNTYSEYYGDQYLTGDEKVIEVLKVDS